MNGDEDVGTRMLGRGSKDKEVDGRTRLEGAGGMVIRLAWAECTIRSSRESERVT